MYIYLKDPTLTYSRNRAEDLAIHYGYLVEAEHHLLNISRFLSKSEREARYADLSERWDHYDIRRAGYDTGALRRIAINLSAYQIRVKPETLARNVIASVNRQKGLVPLARASRNINSFLMTLSRERFKTRDRFMR